MVKKLLIYSNELYCRFRDDDILALGGQMAYSLILSFFPFLIFLITLIGYSSLNSEDVLFALRSVMPSQVFKIVTKTVVEVIDNRNPHLLSFSLIFSIWTASGGFNAIIKGLNRAYDEAEKRPFWRVQLTSVIYMCALVLTILITLLLLVFGELIRVYAVRWAGSLEIMKLIWDILRHAIPIVSTVFVFAALYRYAPSRKLAWNEVFPGALFATVGWLALSLGFAYYVDNIANYSLLYGSIGAIIVLMIWIYFSSNIILLGGEINAILLFEKEGRQKPRCKRF